MKIRNKYSYDHISDSSPEVVDGESMTISGEVLSIQDIFTRYANGGDVPKRRVHYFDEEDLEKVNKFFSPHRLDLTDIDQLNRDVDEMRLAVKSALEKKEQAERDKSQLTIDQPQPESTEDEDE